MRMRKLGSTQSVILIAPEDICDDILLHTSKDIDHVVEVIGVILWTVSDRNGRVTESAAECEKTFGKILSHPDNIEVIHTRLYTHNARLAAQFRSGRVLLAGDSPQPLCSSSDLAVKPPNPEIHSGIGL